MAPIPTQEESQEDSITLGLSLACIVVFLIILMVIYFYKDVANLLRTIWEFLLKQVARLGHIGQANQADPPHGGQNHPHPGHQPHIAPGSNVEDLGPYIELQDLPPAHTVAHPMPSAVRSSARQRDHSSQSQPSSSRQPSSSHQPQTHEQIGFAVSDIDNRRPSTVQEESSSSSSSSSSARELTPPTPPGRPRAIRTIHTYGISQDFSHQSLVPQALAPKKQQSVRVPSSPIGTGIGSGIDGRKLRRARSSPGSKRDARSSRAVSFPQYASPSAVDSGNDDYDDDNSDLPPAIPAKNPRRLSQASQISHRRSFASKPLPELPRRPELDMLPSQSRSQSRSQSQSRDHARRSSSYNNKPKPLFPPTSRDSSAPPMPASYASSQCLPNVGTAATMRSTSADARPPRRGNLPRARAYGDLTVLHQQQQQQKRRYNNSDGKRDDDEEDAEEGVSALYESLSESDFGSTVVHVSPTRK
ncbi:hypothetical protein F5X96DRAFT_693196 [Biscogniauxia mediterranea]|nr:hypothetical protein F5X96DRAFT_693196 [Biscogniauxia mediterranea]